MKYEVFNSRRIHDSVMVVMTLEKIYFIFSAKDEIIIKRPYGYHMNDDGLARCQELFDDPRFPYWVETGEINEF